MEIHSTWIIIIGLWLDIAGVIFVVSPWLYFKRWNYNNTLADIISQQRDVNDEASRRNKQNILMVIGFILLASGFILQIIGNYYQNPPVIL